MAKRANSVYEFTMQDGKLVWDFGAIGKVVHDPDQVSAVNRARAMVFGLKQRIADSAALSRDADTGTSATAEEKFAEMARMNEHLMSGSDVWELRATGPRDDNASWVSKALVALGKATDVEQANAKVKVIADRDFGGEMGKARAKLAKAGAVAEMILKLKSESVKADNSADDLLDEI